MVIPHPQNALLSGYELHWYRIDSILGRGGFGITYLATDTNLGQPVAIKEYLPSAFASRANDSTVQPTDSDNKEVYQWGLERFLSEARTLAQFRHANIVRVYSVFEQNNTAYMVMEYEVGVDLAHLLRNRGTFDEPRLLELFLPVLDGLSLVHDAGFIHRDIKPGNIYVRSDRTPILIDFGSARQALGSHTHTLTSLVTSGFAPFEQYNTQSGVQGPWTDIYAFGATFYRAMVGNAPVDAMARGSARLNDKRDPYDRVSVLAAGRYSDHVLLAVDHALMFREADRPQSARQWMRMLDGTDPVPALADDIYMPPVTKPPGVTTVRRADLTLPAAAEKATPQPPSTDEHDAHVAPAPDVASDAWETQTAPPIARRKRWLIGASLAGVTAAGIATAFFVFSPLSDFSEPTAPITDSRKPDPATERIAERQRSIQGVLAKAESAFRDSRFIDPPGNNALEYYREVLTIDPSSVSARQGVTSIADHFVQLAEEQISRDQLDEAEAILRTAEGIQPDAPSVREARDRLSQRRDTLAQKKLAAAQAAKEQRTAELSTALNEAQGVADSVAGIRADADAVDAITLAASVYAESRQWEADAASRIVTAERSITAEQFAQAETALQEALGLFNKARQGYLGAKQQASAEIERQQARALQQAELRAAREAVENAEARVAGARAAAEGVQAQDRATSLYEESRGLQTDAQQHIADAGNLISDQRITEATDILRGAAELLARAESTFVAARQQSAQKVKAEKTQAERSRAETELSNVRALQNVVADARSAADAVNASKWAGTAYAEASTFQAEAGKQLSAAEQLINEGRYKASESPITTAGALLGDAQRGFEAAQRDARDEIAREKAQALVLAAVEDKRVSVDSAQQRVAKARADAVAVQADRRAPDVFQAARKQESAALSQVNEADGMIAAGELSVADKALTKSLNALDDARGGFERSRKQSRDQIAQEKAIALAEAQAALASLDSTRARVTTARQNAEKVDAQRRASEAYTQARRLQDDALKRIGSAKTLLEEQRVADAQSAIDTALALFMRSETGFASAIDTANQKIATEQVRPKRPDIDVVMERISEFKQAFEGRDYARLEKVAELSDQRRAFVQTLFREYPTIRISVSDFSLLAAEGSASALVVIDQLVNTNGDYVIPGASWKEARIELTKTADEWSRIDW